MESGLNWTETPESSMVKRHAWQDGSLYVEFKNGRQYRYDGLPHTTVLHLQQAPSVGRYIHQNVIPHARAVKLAKGKS